MKEHPIIFTAEEVRAYLDGRKTQTRRVIKPQPEYSTLKPGTVLEPHRCPALGPAHHGRKEWGLYGAPYQASDVPCFAFNCPFGQPGDRLWVQEAWAEVELDDVQGDVTFYRATDANRHIVPGVTVGRWRSSSHMPRWASRTTLDVTTMRVERVQDISDADARAEGMPDTGCGGQRLHFSIVWDAINAKRTILHVWEDDNEVVHRERVPANYGWDANPWVWVVEFARRKT